MIFVFWTAFSIVLFNYVIYPFAVILFSRMSPKPPDPKPYEPSVSVVIAAFNEEKVIKEKIENTLALGYPKEKLQIVIVSDGSSDRTHDIVSSHADKGVISLHEPDRNGKSAALNRGVALATGEIIVFSDANNMFDSDAIKSLVRHFSDEHVGGVSGAKKIIPHVRRMSSTGDSLYWKYESAIKKAESILGSITAADGEITAIRRDLFEPIEKDIINDDAAVTLAVIRRGYRFLYDEKAVSREYASVSLKDDFYVKVRMVAGGFQTLKKFKDDLWPPKTLFRIQFLLHKALRWVVPECLVLLLLSNIIVADRQIYLLILWSQILFYIFSCIGYLLLKGGKTVLIFYLPLYFTVMNAAAFMGLVRYLNKKQGVGWRKAAR